MSTDNLINGLNEDLSAELGTIIRYNYQAGKSTGFMGTEMRKMFSGELKDEMRHARFLTDVISDMGGEPVTKPKNFEKPDSIKDMLELDLMMEEKDVKNYRKHSSQAEELGLMELKVKLEEIAADEASHARKIRRILKGI